MLAKYITLAEALALSGLSRQRIWQLAKRGTIRRGNVGGRLGYHRGDLLQYINSNKDKGGRPCKH